MEHELKDLTFFWI